MSNSPTAAAPLYNVEALWPSTARAYFAQSAVVTAAAGVESDNGGFGFGQRDLSWDGLTAATAAAMVARIARCNIAGLTVDACPMDYGMEGEGL